MSSAESWGSTSQSEISGDLSVDHVGFYVSDLTSARETLINGYGFEEYATEVASPGRFTPRKSALGHGDIRLLITEASIEDPESVSYVEKHGNGVAVIALGTSNARAAFVGAVSRGAEPVSEPSEFNGVTTASIRGVGDVVHKFVERPAGADPRVLPWLKPCGKEANAAKIGLHAIDHFAVCLEAGKLDSTVRFYEDVLGFRMIFKEHIKVGAQAMHSKVVQSVSGNVTLTLIEPDVSREPGQIDEFIKKHNGPGVQHIAMTAKDIVESVGAMRERGVAFLGSPSAYYSLVRRRLELMRHSVDELQRFNILVDQDHDGQLFQIFTRSVHSRGTLFMEIIERAGARTFGSGNIKALYEAVELERTEMGVNE